MADKADIYYQGAANALRVYLEDNRLEALSSTEQVRKVLYAALLARYFANGVESSQAEDFAMEDSEVIAMLLDTLRPILEAYWEAQSS